MPTAVFLGNFSKPWCSEVHWARELRSLGWTVREFQEPRMPGDRREFLRVVEGWCADNRPELLIYTRTYGLPPEAELVWRRLEARGTITCSYHLDLYVGLPREEDVGDNPFWKTQHVFTADGDPHSAEAFRERGVNHHWLSPAVVSDEAVEGMWRDEYNYDVIFVGSKGYHPEWPWRTQMLDYLEQRYGSRFRRFNWDMPEGPTRGLDLNDLYATAKVVVGDALVLPGHINYWSDRYFETIGRGGFLIAPEIPGLEKFLVAGEHYASYFHPMGPSFPVKTALDALGATVDHWLASPTRRDEIRKAGFEHVREHHTYRHRWQEALKIMGLESGAGIEKLELGSGYHPTPGFTHLDMNSALPDVDIVGPAWPLGLPDGSVGEIRAVDVLEHLSYWDTPEVLADWFRVLKPEGKLFVQVPDAERIMDWYVNSPKKLSVPDGLPKTALAGATWRLLGGHNDGKYVKEEQDFRLNAHYAMFSTESLTQALVAAGFDVTMIRTNPHPNILCEAVKPLPKAPAAPRRKPKKVEGEPKIGLIARGEAARGLGLMTKGFYDHMPVERVLLAKILNRDCGVFGENWYPGATQIDVQGGYTLDEKIVKPWLEGLDVVYTAETPYDWRMPRWCRESGVKLVVHGMPEFVRHGQPGTAHLEDPDEWWWPTSWRIESLPAGPVVPVPMPDHESTSAPVDDREMHVYHIAGKRAFADRNGTDTFVDALRGLDKRTNVTIYGLEGSLPDIQRPRNLPDLRIDNDGPVDRWEMHRGQHLLVLPRRYAGLCLPALEAASRGMAVMMPDVSPNRELASVLVPPHAGKDIRVPCGRIPTSGIHFFALAQEINALNADRDRLGLAMKRSFEMVPRWSEYRDVYLSHFRRVLGW